MLWLGLFADAIGFESLFMQIWRDREVILTLNEKTNGHRIHLETNMIGGCRKDIDESLAKAYVDDLSIVREKMENLRSVFYKDSALKAKNNEKLALEGFHYEGKAELLHVFELLYDKLGKEKIAAAVIKPLTGFRFGAHPGCHSIRPSSLGRPDDSENPHKLDDLINWTGAQAVEYPGKVDCCGSSLASVSGKTVMEIAGDKLKTVKGLALDGLVTTCPFCFKVYDNRQRAIAAAVGDRSLEVPVFYYTQLLGLAMGIGQERLGLELNQSPVDPVLARIGGA